MSRTRIVGGNIYKTIGGNYNMYAEESIITHANGNITETGEESGVTFNNPRNPPILETITTECVVEFRTKQDGTYTGQFGFDWLRVDDNGLTTETKYYDILENGYEAPNGRAPHRDANNDYENKDEAFKALKKQYKKISINILPRPAVAPFTRDYFVPYLNIFSKPVSDATVVPTGTPKPPFEVELRTLVEVGGTDEPDQIRVVFDKRYFEINGKNGDDANQVLIADKTLGAKREATADILKIKCIADYTTDQTIKVFVYPKGSLARTLPEQLAARKLAGKIIVLPNDVTHRKIQKFVFVNVRTNINKVTGMDVVGNFNSNEKDNLQHALHQALIHGEFDSYVGDFDLTTDANFQINTNAISGVRTYGKFIYEKALIEGRTLRTDTSDGGLYEDIANKEMFIYLRAQFLALPGNTAKYANHFTAFCFADIPYDMVVSSGGYSGTLGQAQAINKKNVFIFSIRNDFTLNHEGLHGLGLEHTHPGGTTTPSKKFIFKLYETTNIMSYPSTSAGHPASSKTTTWKWQWKIEQSNAL